MHLQENMLFDLCQPLFDRNQHIQNSSYKKFGSVTVSVMSRKYKALGSIQADD